MTLPSLLAFRGRIGRVPYGLWSAAIFFLPHAAVWGVFDLAGQPLMPDWRFWAMPFASLAQLPLVPVFALPLAFAAMLLVLWMLTALAFQRAADAGADGWIATLVAAPAVQIPAMALLLVLPPRPPAPPRVATARDAVLDWTPAVQGVLAGIGLTLFAVAAGALVFGTYGYGIFVLSPFVIGAATAFLANRRQDIGWPRTLRLFTLSLSLGAVALVVFALEGIVCIVLAAPLAWGAALLGALLGHALAQSPRRRAGSTLTSVALLPVVFLMEKALPPTMTFATDERIEIAAPPAAVWQALIHMDRIDGPPSLPFRLGVAYPVSGAIRGQGVGAIRTGVFSTGIAVERVTAWMPDRRLAFTVLRDPPAMHEMSPYAHVNAPHVTGYFRTVSTAFEIVPRLGGGSVLLEHTEHRLRLDPVLYWLPLARWIIHQNNERVLAYIGRHAERIALKAS